MNEVEINGVVYVPKGTDQSFAPNVDGYPLVIIRAASAGVHYGYLHSRVGDEVVLKRSRRVFYWSGACSLSQLAVDGTAKPAECKISVDVPEIVVLGVIEIIPVTSKAKASIDGVKEWKS